MSELQEIEKARKYIDKAHAKVEKAAGYCRQDRRRKEYDDAELSLERAFSALHEAMRQIEVERKG